MFADDHESSREPTRPTVTLFTGVDFFLTDRGIYFSHNTLNAYQADLDQFTSWMTDQHNIYDIAKMSPLHMMQYREHLHRSTYAPATIQRKLAAVRTFLRYLWDTKMTSRPLATYIPHDATEQTKPESLSLQSVATLLSAPKKHPRNKTECRDTAILYLLYMTGMRVGELVETDVSSIRKTDTAMTIRINKSKPRTLLLDDTLLQDILDDYLEKERPVLAKKNRVADPSPALFLNLSGRRLSRQGVWYMFRQYAQSVGLSPSLVTPRTLRNTTIHTLVNSEALHHEADLERSFGINPKALKRYLLDSTRSRTP